MKTIATLFLAAVLASSLSATNRTASVIHAAPSALAQDVVEGKRTSPRKDQKIQKKEARKSNKSAKFENKTKK